MIADKTQSLRYLHLGSALVLTLAFSCLFFYYSNTQPPLTHGRGMGWDGAHYYRVAEQFLRGAPISEVRSMVYRIGTPALAAATVHLGFADDIKEGFFAVNMIFSLLNTFLIYFLISRFTTPSVALIGGLLYPMHWISSARHMFYTPLWTDPGGLFFLYLGFAVMIALRERQATLSVVLSVVAGLGLLFRDFVLVLPVLFIITRIPMSQFVGAARLTKWGELSKTIRPLTLPLATAIVVMALIRLNVEATSSYGFSKDALYFLWVNSPQFLLYSLFSNFGIALLFLVLQWRAVADYLRNHSLVLFTLAMTLAAAFIGGDNNERYINWVFPFFFVLIAKAIEWEGLPRWAIITLIVFSIVFVCRLPWIIPDYRTNAVSPFPFFTYLTDDFRFLDLFVIHSKKNVSGIIFYQYLLASAMLALVLRRQWVLSIMRRFLGRSESGSDESREN